MNLSVFPEIEMKVNLLSREEQLKLIERLAQNLRTSTNRYSSVEENQLAAMASDPEIRSELKKIEKEFAVAEMDGLENE